MALGYHRWVRNGWWYLCAAAAVAVPAHAQEYDRAGERGGSPASGTDEDSQAGSDLRHGDPSLTDYGYYEPVFRVDQYARVAVRCLGVEGSPTVSVRFRLEVHNASERDIRIRASETRLQWTRRARAPRGGPYRPHHVDGPTTVEPGETREILLRFEPRGHVSPEEVHLVQLQWTLRSGYGTQPVHQSTFVRDGHGERVRYAFVPRIVRNLGLPVDPWRRHRRW
jgi:hypothetical protein